MHMIRMIENFVHRSSAVIKHDVMVQDDGCQVLQAF